MVSNAYKRKRENFKQANLSLYKFFIVIFFLATPLILFIVPLPGYLIINAEYLIPTIVATLIFILVAALESMIYWRLWSREELLFISSIKADSNLIGIHFKCFIETCYGYHILIFAALFKSELSISAILYLLISYVLVTASFYITYLHKMSAKPPLLKIGFSQLTIIGKVICLYLNNGVVLRLSLLFLVLLISLSLQMNNIGDVAMYYFSLLFIVFIVYLNHSIFNILKLNTLIHQDFFRLISPKLFTRQKVMISSILLILLISSLLLNFSYLFGI